MDSSAVISAFWWFSRRRARRLDVTSLLDLSRIVVVDSEAACNEVVEGLLGPERPAVVGLDCEWANSPSLRGNRGGGGGNRSGGDVARTKVDLLQLATFDRAVLVRLRKMRGKFPKKLEEMMEDKSILKVGVAVCEDAVRLRNDYGVRVGGCLDLRHIATRCRYGWWTGGGTVIERASGLQSLAATVLGVALEKSFRVRCSDWGAERLTDKQVMYAANDAYVAVKIFERLMCWDNGRELGKDGIGAYETVIDVPFKYKSKKLSKNKKGCKPLKPKASSYATRHSPLYDNCRLEAPNGILLCTCDRRKIDWYLKRNLAEIVCEDPPTARLNFEPSGVPDESRKYYLANKLNVCVVCGKDNSYLRKNVVPHEYRKHFPADMKNHRSHDVLLLCTDCHRLSDYNDGLLRQKLAADYRAPVSGSQAARQSRNPQLVRVRSAANALMQKKHRLPQQRKMNLESVLKDHYDVEEISEDLLKESASMDATKTLDEEYVSHGEMVIAAAKAQGKLKDFERMWRQHFLDTMHPQYLPAHWSVTHNQ